MHRKLVWSFGNSLPDAIGCAGYMRHLPKKHLSGSIESRPCVSTFASTLEVSFKPLLAHMNCSTKAHFYRIQGHPMTKYIKSGEGHDALRMWAVPVAEKSETNDM